MLSAGIACLVCASCSVWADEPAPTSKAAADNSAVSGGWLDQVEDTLKQTWNSDQYELYVPLHTWHNRRMYTADKVKTYNENPWGIGFGKYRYDSDGNWHGIYAMEFADSHHNIEPIAGYGYEKIWRPTENWRLGVGYTAGVTMREDYHWIPIPLVLPLASIEYKKFSLQTTYVPGGKGNGNVLFTWARWQL